MKQIINHVPHRIVVVFMRSIAKSYLIEAYYIKNNSFYIFCQFILLISWMGPILEFSFGLFIKFYIISILLYHLLYELECFIIMAL